MVKVVKRFSCEEAVELVTAFLEGELDEPTRHRFEEHLGGCEGCERYLDQFRVTVEALGRLRTAEAPDRPHDAAKADEAAKADDPHHDNALTTDTTDTADTADAPGPPRPGGLPEGMRDRLRAAFRAGRPT
ncbi:zf-HC2 domain-containing protein [Streptosporangium sp. NPDC023825]|uniref:anti-sigma factor family protein n=1 Tax=Streptosporangium sp. NPDC023825 TaxID=3154909 RepID=UPI0034200529